jgi:hypothetical protein
MRSKLLKAAGALLVVIPMFAFSIPTASATVIICTPNTGTRYRITSYTTAGVLNTGLIIATIPPAGSATREATTTKSYTASVTISTGTSVSASTVIAKAEVSVGFALQASGTTTKTESIAITARNTTTAYHDWIFFDGEKTGSGTWARDRCNSNGTGYILNVATGPWKSWHAQIVGAVRCDQDSTIKSTYGGNSPQYKAATMC